MPLDTLVVDAEKIPLSDDDVVGIAFGMTKIVRYSDLHKHESIFELLRPYSNFILFYEIESLQEGHWVCVLYHEDINTIEFFDSYGMDDVQIMKKADTSNDRSANYFNGEPYLTALFRKARSERQTKIIINTYKFQSLSKNVQTCGRYAALRSRFREAKYQQFADLLMKNKYSSDYMVSALTVMFSEAAISYILN